jgi:hypothetical protein
VFAELVNAVRVCSLGQITDACSKSAAVPPQHVVDSIRRKEQCPIFSSTI